MILPVQVHPMSARSLRRISVNLHGLLYSLAGFVRDVPTCALTFPGALVICRWDEVERWAQRLAAFAAVESAAGAAPGCATGTSPPESGEGRS